MEDGNRTRVVFPNSAILLSLSLSPSLWVFVVARAEREITNGYRISTGLNFADTAPCLHVYCPPLVLPPPGTEYSFETSESWRGRFKSLCYAATLYILMTRIRRVSVSPMLKRTWRRWLLMGKMKFGWEFVWRKLGFWYFLKESQRWLLYFSCLNQILCYDICCWGNNKYVIFKSSLNVYLFILCWDKYE